MKKAEVDACLQNAENILKPSRNQYRTFDPVESERRLEKATLQRQIDLKIKSKQAMYDQRVYEEKTRYNQDLVISALQFEIADLKKQNIPSSPRMLTLRSHIKSTQHHLEKVQKLKAEREIQAKNVIQMQERKIEQLKEKLH